MLHQFTLVTFYLLAFNLVLLGTTIMFPRYVYNLELINKIVDRVYQTDDNIITHDLSKLADSTILVYGRETDVDRNLLQPLILEDENGNYGFNKFCFKDDVHKAYHFFNVVM